MAIERYFTLKMTRVFPPEKAANLRPAMAVAQRIVDAEQERIATEVREKMLRHLLYGSYE